MKSKQLSQAGLLLDFWEACTLNGFHNFFMHA